MKNYNMVFRRLNPSYSCYSIEVALRIAMVNPDLDHVIARKNEIINKRKPQSFRAICLNIHN
ncbi:MAG: hypothetical protein M1431_05605 [Candidatus Thermoplasmatota archaeon]|nr:hypothetical protein [Candidatus Thermoplasmatota archaeon]